MRDEGARPGVSRAAVLLVAWAFASPAGAQSPVGTAFTYQGRLEDAGVPANGAYDLQFALFDAPTAGAQVGPLLTRDDVAVSTGLFTVSLDFGAIFAGQKRWIELRVRPGTSTGAYTTLTPRQELTPAPNAVFSATVPWSGVSSKPAGFADDVDNDALGALACAGNQVPRWSGSSWTCVAHNGHDHFGQAWSGAALGLRVDSATADGLVGVATATAGFTAGVRGESHSSTGRGVIARATSLAGVTFGVEAEINAPGGAGVSGLSHATTGNGEGVYGETNAPNGTGVRGVASSTGASTFGVYGSAAGSGAGVRGTSELGPGVHGITSATNGIGVRGEAVTDGSPVGVFGLSPGSTGVGVVGNATGTAFGIGMLGSSSGTTGTGVRGQAVATQGTTVGVYGAASSSAGFGVLGQALASGGVGVYGSHVVAGGLAGLFEGNVSVLGTLSKSAGSFKIDHPLDPANKYLSHSFVESPDMMNVYNGNVVLDARGEAEVVLPDWFEALNRDFRYQLTAIGQPGPGLHVAAKVKGNRFRIGGGSPGMEVSWQVTGIRHDAYAEKHRIAVEEDKAPADRGRYLQPEALGQPADAVVDVARRARERNVPGPVSVP